MDTVKTASLWRSVIYVLVRTGFIALAVFTASNGDYEAMAIALVGLALSLVPQLLSRQFNIKLPLMYELVILSLVVGSIMLGELMGAYSRFWWWDSMLHLSSGIIIGYIGYMILFTLSMQEKLKVSAGMMAFLTFSVSMMCAAMWEVIEFAIDGVFNSSMQLSNTDTMKDIVLAMIGSLIATAAIYWHHRWPERSPLRDELQHFAQANRHLLPPKYRKRPVRKGDVA